MSGDLTEMKWTNLDHLERAQQKSLTWEGELTFVHPCYQLNTTLALT